MFRDQEDMQSLHMKAEILKLIAEAQKLNAEQQKLNAEQIKLHHEAIKISRDAFWSPIAIASGLIGAVVAATATVLKLLT